jgi:hypothetical protein
MVRAKFLRRQAETCLRLSEQCSDSATAEHLRLMAAEFFRRLTEHKDQPSTHGAANKTEETGDAVGSRRCPSG